MFADRGGIGMEELKKRKADEELQNYRRKVQMKQHVEKKSLEDFRYKPAQAHVFNSIKPAVLYLIHEFGQYYCLV